MTRQDDFPQPVKDILARRVRHLCSNPGCRQPTTGPAASNSTRAINIGVAAHITAAAPNGPRYDPSLSREQRQSANNGLWCCQNCAKLIDSDPNGYTIPVLHEWKSRAEQEALATIENPTVRLQHSDCKFSWSCRQVLFSSHCLRLVFHLSNEGFQPIREYAVKFFLPAQLARHLRYHNSSDPIQDEILAFRGPLLWDHAASHTLTSQLNGNVHTVIPAAKMVDHPLLPAGPAIPVAELDFGFTGEKERFVDSIIPYEIKAEFWVGIKQQITMRLSKQPDGTLVYIETCPQIFSPANLDAKRVIRVLQDLEKQLLIPGQSRAIAKSSQNVIDSAITKLQADGWHNQQIRIWPAEEGDAADNQYYIEISADNP